MRGRLVAAMALVALAWAGAYGLKAGWLAVPSAYDPWAELEPTAPVNMLTPLKLRRARDDPARCFAALTRLDARYTRVPDRETGPDCGFHDALRLSAIGGSKLQPPATLSCRVGLSFGMWERHAVQPAAEVHLGSPVASIRSLGGYACRDVNTGEPPTQGGRRSRHATADAIDIGAFVTADGRTVSIGRDWPHADAAVQPDRAAFLRDLHGGACRFFDGVLGPDYNAVHRDHFHLEDSGWPACR